MFGIDQNSTLSLLRILNKQDLLINQIKGENKSTQTKIIQIENNQHIVSASVEVNGRCVESVQFIVYEAKQ